MKPARLAATYNAVADGCPMPRAREQISEPPYSMMHVKSSDFIQARSRCTAAEKGLKVGCS